MKLARQYFVETGEPSVAISLRLAGGYHGNTLGVLAVGGNAWRRAPFAPPLVEAIPCVALLSLPGAAWRRNPGRKWAAPGTGVGRNHYTVGPKSVIAFVAETVGGATAWLCWCRCRGIFGCARGVERAIRSLIRGSRSDEELDIQAIAKGLGAVATSRLAPCWPSRISHRAIGQAAGFFSMGTLIWGIRSRVLLRWQCWKPSSNVTAWLNVCSAQAQFMSVCRCRVRIRMWGDIRGRGGFFWGWNWCVIGNYRRRSTLH